MSEPVAAQSKHPAIAVKKQRKRQPAPAVKRKKINRDPSGTTPARLAVVAKKLKADPLTDTDSKSTDTDSWSDWSSELGDEITDEVLHALAAESNSDNEGYDDEYDGYDAHEAESEHRSLRMQHGHSAKFRARPVPAEDSDDNDMDDGDYDNGNDVGLQMHVGGSHAGSSAPRKGKVATVPLRTTHASASSLSYRDPVNRESHGGISSHRRVRTMRVDTSMKPMQPNAPPGYVARSSPHLPLSSDGFSCSEDDWPETIAEYAPDKPPRSRSSISHDSDGDHVSKQAPGSSSRATR